MEDRLYKGIEHIILLCDFFYIFLVCVIPMGVQSKYIIGDSQMTVSSSEGPNMTATSGRIYGENGWSPR